MVQRNSRKEPDVIIVGGGRASADFIPDLCDALGERIRGVVFIDHDMGEITALESIINGCNINFSYVRLEKRPLERNLFDDYVNEMGLDGYAEWEDDLTTHPPMLRVQTRLRERAIFDAVWNLLPTQGGRLVLPRVNIVFAFGMTGMTSSTVALEAGTTIRRAINEQIANSGFGVLSNIDAPPPRQVGIGLFPPDPSEDAGDFNLLQGLNVANALEHTLPQNSLSTPEGAPFDKFLLIDGSGFRRTQNLQQFDEWASRSATTLLTCETITGKTFFDVNEMFNEIAPYNNLALICVGGGPEDMAAIEWLHDTDDKVKRVQAGEASAGQTTKDIVSEELPRQLAIERPQSKFNVVNEFNALKEADAELDAANEQYKRRNFFPKLKQRREVVEARIIRDWSLEALGAKAHEVAENCREYWSEVQFARMWVMPDTNDPSLPLGGDDRQRMDMNERLGQALRYTINPMIDLDKKIKRCTVIVAGSPDAREKFPLPGDALIRTFGGSWEIRAGQGDIDDSEPIHYLMLWEPDDNRILPRFYRERSGIKVSQMPSEYNAWPNFTQDAGRPCSAIELLDASDELVSNLQERKQATPGGVQIARWLIAGIGGTVVVAVIAALLWVKRTDDSSSKADDDDADEGGRRR